MQAQITGLRASSAGTRAVVGHPIHRAAALTLESLGGDSTNFSARQLTPQVASAADLVLTMTSAHRDLVLELAPRQFKRTFTLVEAARIVSDCSPGSVADLASLRSCVPAAAELSIPDPIGQGVSAFAMVGDQIAQALARVLDLCAIPLTSE